MNIEHRIKGEQAAEPARVIEWSLASNGTSVHVEADGETVIFFLRGEVEVWCSAYMRAAGMADDDGFLKIQGYTRNDLLPYQDDTFFEAVRAYWSKRGLPSELTSILDAETARREKEKQG